MLFPKHEINTVHFQKKIMKSQISIKNFATIAMKTCMLDYLALNIAEITPSSITYHRKL